jgi:hypothetical protein
MRRWPFILKIGVGYRRNVMDVLWLIREIGG